MTAHDAPRQPGDRGSIALEFVFLAIVVVLLIALVSAYGRVAQVNGTLDAGARDAARMATTARSYDQAVTLARQAVSEEVTVEACHNSLDVQVSKPFEPGKSITVTATCQYSLSDIGLVFGANMHPKSTFTSPLDPNRGLNS